MVRPLVRCVGCNTWQHARKGHCPKCAGFTSRKVRESHEFEAEQKQMIEAHKAKTNADWTEESLDMAKATLAGFKEKDAARRRVISESKRGADEAVERSKALAMLCITTYRKGDELPPAAVMSRMLYQERGIVLHKVVLVRWLKQFGYNKTQDGWRRKYA